MVVEKKKCSVCGEEKHISEFHKDKRKPDGLDGRCKVCKAKYLKEYKKTLDYSPQIEGSKNCTGCQEEKHISKFQPRKHNKNGRDSRCRDCVSEAAKKHRATLNNPPMIEGLKVCIDCQEEKHVFMFYAYKIASDGLIPRCKVCTDIRSGNYRENNKEKINAYVRKRNKERYYSDVEFRLTSTVRNRLNQAIKGNQKAGSAVRDLDCTVRELKKRFESMFHPHPETGEEMTWDNWSKTGWHIDHIIPLSFFDLTDREQFKKAFRYTNLQPLWAEENLSKGSKMPEDHYEVGRKYSLEGEIV